MEKHSLLVAHRVCPVLARTAVGFDSKSELVRASLASLAVALKNAPVRVRLVFILDGCPKEYEALIAGLFDAVDNLSYEIERTASVGNRATYRRQLEIFEADMTAEFFYFSEDDYLYRPNAFSAMLDFARLPDVDFVTPLDHPDRYRQNALITMPFSRTVRATRGGGGHWMDVENTCLTFLVKRSVFGRTKRVFDAYATGTDDWAMWLALTKKGVWRMEGFLLAPLLWLFGWKSILHYYLPLIVWRRHAGRLLFSRRYKLWQPIPTLAVHVCSESLPPRAEELAPDFARDAIRTAGLRYLGC